MLGPARREAVLMKSSGMEEAGEEGVGRGALAGAAPAGAGKPRRPVS